MHFLTKDKSNWLPPLLFLVVLIFAFGVMLPRLGFYWDDWPPILIAKMQNTHMFWEFYQYDRPFSAWTYVTLFPILGTKPLTWQIFTLGMRWLTTVFVWLSLREIWPTHRKQAIWAALFFALYPSFDQQALSVAFSQHWICYLFYVASIWAMVKAVHTKAISYSILSYILAVIQLWTMEYFAALELLRPFILLILASETEEGWRRRLSLMWKRWWPYCVIFAAFVYWRIFLLEFPGEDPNPIVIFDQLRENPLTALWQFFELSFQDTLFTLFGVWNQTIQGNAIELDSPFFRLAIGVSFLSAGVVWYVLSSFQDGKNEGNLASPVQWGYQAMALGLIAVLLGAFPAWMAGRETTASFYSSRFSLASIFGAGLFLVGLLEWVTPRYFVKITLVSAMILVTTNYHLRINDGYRESWDAQKRFYWQLYWRAPYIEPNTPLISDNEVLLYAGGYTTAMGINLTYHEGAQPENMAYWLFVLDDRLEGQISRFHNGKSLEGELRNLHFTGESTNSLIINNSAQGCLHMLADRRAENALLPDALQQIVPISNLSRIHLETDKLPPDPDIFGPEPEHTWCYYYEKAELARQLEDWEQVTRLGDEARNSGYAASDPIEWFVFIKGYGLKGNADQAASITHQVFETRGDYGLALCDLWQEMAGRQQGDVALQSEWKKLQGSSLCQPE